MNKRFLRIHYLQHVPFEGLGCIGSWVKEKEYKLSVTRFYEGEVLPLINEFDMLIVMGGPMGVYDDEKYSWMQAEKEFIKKAIDHKKIVLGICLGAQLIASSLGARVFPNKVREIGWLPITFSEERILIDLFGTKIKSPTVFQWHGDTFDLPDGAKLLASSKACPNQAFMHGNRVLGLQFHLEVTNESCEAMLKHGTDELIHSEYVQSADFIRTNKHHIPLCNTMMISILENFIPDNDN